MDRFTLCLWVVFQKHIGQTHNPLTLVVIQHQGQCLLAKLSISARILSFPAI